MNRAYLFVLSLFCLIILSENCNYTNYQQGKVLYETNCAVCHMADGSGVAKLYPSLNKLSESGINPQSIPCIIRNGLQRDGSVIEMAALAELSDVEINNIVNFIAFDMNKIESEITIAQTKELLNKCK